MNLLRIALCITTVLLAITGTLADGPSSCSQQGINIGRTLLDSTAKEIFFATEDQQDVYVLTTAGTVYRSTDRGETWVNKMSHFPQWNNASISFGGSSGVKDIHGSGKNGVVYFEGHGLAYWSTRGDDVYKLHTLGYVDGSSINGDYIYKMRAHPTNENYLMLISWDSLCFSTNYEYCFFKTEVSAFQGLEGSWNLIDDYTFSAHWGKNEDQIFLLSMAEDERYANQLEVPSYSPGKQLLAMSSYGSVIDVTLPGVLDYEFTNDILYFAKYVEDGYATTYVSTSIDSANEMVLGGSGNYTGVYFQILESSADVSLIAVRNSYSNNYGHLFQSASDDPNYWTSLQYIRMVDGADFYTTKDLDGIYMANVYNETYIDEGEYHTHTMITFDQGGLWNPITIGDNERYLHLFLTDEYAGQEPHSDEHAIGIIYALGNEGNLANPSSDDIGLYLSRSAGYTWERVLDGLFRFSFNDHASITVAISSEDTASEILYSWNQGSEWNSCAWGDQFYARSVIPLTSEENGLQFLIIGDYENGQGTVLYLDFTDNVPRVCDTYSDYEFFQPSIGDVCLLGRGSTYVRRKRDSECAIPELTLGVDDDYSCECARQDFQCDGECFEETHVEGELNTVCMNICEGTEDDPTLPPEECSGTYYQTQGYKKIPGDVCIGGEQWLPIELPCPGSDVSESPTPTVTPTTSETPSPSVEPKTPTITASPTVSIKQEDGSPTITPSPSEVVEPSSQESISVTTESPSPTISESVESPTPSESTIPKSNSPSTSPSRTNKNPSIVATASIMETFTQTNGTNTTEPESSSFIWIVIAGSAVVGVIILLVILILGVAFVIYNKSKRGKSKPDYMEEDLFSLEDNDEWEL